MTGTLSPMRVVWFNTTRWLGEEGAVGATIYFY